MFANFQLLHLLPDIFGAWFYVLIQDDSDFDKLYLYRIMTFRNTEIDKWQRKIQVTTGAAALKGKLHAFNQVA
jgi:hypothetical protein